MIRTLGPLANKADEPAGANLSRKPNRPSRRLPPERYRELFELSPTATALFDRSGRCRLFNRAMRPLLGISAAGPEAPDFSLADLLASSEEADQLLAEMEARQVIRRREIELLDAEGRAVPALLSGQSLRWRGKLHFELSFTDLSRVRNLERASSRELVRLSALAEALPAGLMQVDSSGLVARFNPALGELLGLNPGSVIGTPHARVVRRLAGLASDPESARKSIGAAVANVAERPHLQLPLAGRGGRMEILFFPLFDSLEGPFGWGILVHRLPGNVRRRRGADRVLSGAAVSQWEPFGRPVPPGTILVLATNPELQWLCHTSLAADGYSVHAAPSLPDAIRRLRQGQVELVVVEWPSAEDEGPRWVRALGRSSPSPILVLMPSSRQTDLMAALDAGADDYLTLPFSGEDLVARAQFTARQAGRLYGLGNTLDHLEFEDLIIELDTRRVRRGDRFVELTPTEFDLLALLAQHRNQILSHEQLMGRIWGTAASRQRLFAHINRLRAKLEADPAHPRFIVTRWGLGYVFGPD